VPAVLCVGELPLIHNQSPQLQCVRFSDRPVESTAEIDDGLWSVVFPVPVRSQVPRPCCFISRAKALLSRMDKDLDFAIALSLEEIDNQNSSRVAGTEDGKQGKGDTDFRQTPAVGVSVRTGGFDRKAASASASVSASAPAPSSSPSPTRHDQRTAVLTAKPAPAAADQEALNPRNYNDGNKRTMPSNEADVGGGSGSSGSRTLLGGINDMFCDFASKFSSPSSSASGGGDAPPQAGFGSSMTCFHCNSFLGNIEPVLFI
jgi:hypothetical protein